MSKTKLCVPVRLLGALAWCASTAAFGWGVEGHAIVADIAARRLTPQAAAEVRKILGYEGATSMEQVASWADQVKGTDPDGPTHSVRLPLDDSPYDPAAPCRKYKCAITEFEEDRAVLQNPCTAPLERDEALKYVIHLAGDLHQPLHATSAFKAFVQFKGKTYGFHKFWDTILIRQMKGTPDQLAVDIMTRYGNVSDGGTPADWAIEGRDIVRDQLAPMVENARGGGVVPLPDDYLSFAIPIAQKRLAQGGVRLARTLNDAFAAAATAPACTTP